MLPGSFCHLTLNLALSVDDALSAGMAGVGLTIPTGSLWLAATSLIPNVTRLTGTTSKGALESQGRDRTEDSSLLVLHEQYYNQQPVTTQTWQRCLVTLSQHSLAPQFRRV